MGNCPQCRLLQNTEGFIMVVTVELKEFFKENPRAALAFSGGADSAYLLYAAKKCGAEVKAYYVKTQFQPQFELEDAKRLASETDAELEIIRLDILSADEVAENTENRCYYCKRRIFGAIAERAVRDGYNLILDGTNASDEEGDRPGMRALRELNVRSPLRECSLTKAKTRALSREAGLFTWDKPAYACLATRISCGERISGETLRRVEAAEDCLFLLGFTDFRARVFNGAARLQFPSEQLDEAVKRREEILKAIKPYFDDVLIDLKCR